MWLDFFGFSEGNVKHYPKQLSIKSFNILKDCHIFSLFCALFFRTFCLELFNLFSSSFIPSFFHSFFLLLFFLFIFYLFIYVFIFLYFFLSLFLLLCFFLSFFFPFFFFLSFYLSFYLSVWLINQTKYYSIVYNL